MSKTKNQTNFSNLKIIKLIWKNLNPLRRKQVLGLSLIMVTCGIAEISNLILLKNFLSILNSGDSINHPILIIKISNWLNIDNNIFLLSVFLFIISCIFTGSIRVLNLWLSGVLAAKITSDISIKAFSKVIFKDYTEHIKNNSSNILNKLSTSVNALTVVLGYILNIFSSLIIITILFIGLCYVDLFLSLLSIFVFSITYYLLFSKSRLFLSRNSALALKYSESHLKIIQEIFGSFRDVIINSNQSFFIKKYKEIDIPLRYKFAQNRFVQASPRYILENIGFIFLALLTFILSTKNTNIIPTLGVLALAAQKILPSMQLIFQGITGFRANSSQVYDVFDTLSLKNKHRGINLKSKKLIFKNSIQIKNLYFKYSDKSFNILDGININLKKGDHLGIIGSSGCGKSTLIDIFMGLIPPDKGNVFIDNTPLDIKNNYNNLNYWQSIITHVPQSIFLIDGSILENIAFGIKKEEINLNKVWEVVRLAKIEDYINSLDNGINTKVGERGIYLSGGQIQRIGIARALYKDAEILILDEATSALDTITEKNVISSISDLKNKMTLITITHRLSTLEKCDQIIKLKNGKIVPVKLEK